MTTAPRATSSTDVRWLDPEEQRTWRLYLTATKRLSEVLERELSSRTEVPHAYYEVLVRLSEAPERTLRMSELAENSLSSRSRLSHAVTRMEEKGWILRESCPSDGRGFNARLTDDGFAALETAAPVHVRGVREHLFDQLTPEQVAQLHAIVASMAAHLTEG